VYCCYSVDSHSGLFNLYESWSIGLQVSKQDACNSTVSSLIGGSCSFGGGNEFLLVSASLNFDRS
jgi:hypothetical protein